MKINVDFTVQVVKAGRIINRFPDFLKPCIVYLLRSLRMTDASDIKLIGWLGSFLAKYPLI